MRKKKTKGVLPSKEWLTKNGHKWLVESMEKHPEMFSHIKQNKPAKMQKERK